jgi:hypothetical protein
MSDHAATALDQLAVADSLAETWEQQFTHALEASKVHALLAIAEAVRDDGMTAPVWPVWP